MTETITLEQYKEYVKTGKLPAPAIPPGKAAPAPQLSKADTKAEKILQAECEGWLHHRGYLRLTDENAKSISESTRGFFGHMQKPKGNPLMPDLWILDRKGRCLMVELKVRSVYQPGQKEMIDAEAWIECRTFQDFEMIITTWEYQV